ncbi:diguanylate cyclase (GGDEF)-like protein [Rhizobium sp. SG_E_25_P2]|uniref:bifunctional diguanylate cyclase/phosphodiesterase n=1 Tax=Rhizobium sp. SG_E_25_P2 TaxID=2879942 RepID=UPI002475F8D9|nr:EAL domain-containing protein [Rhizobium sp. SG_E_25_P2]MDH6268283.1 diguanylate cyclase (GGDEF)-like protein [Rhizobium sp. SG_E_25_P2]
MLQSLQNTILELIAIGEPLKPTLDRLCSMVEDIIPDIVCSVLEVDAQGRLHPLSAPSLPAYYCDALEGLAIGPKVGSCGTAAFLGKPVIVTDIANDPLWEDYKSLPLPLGLRACWSTPIISQGVVIGTFGFYFSETRGPTEFETKIVAASTHLTAIALEREARVRERQRLAFTDSLTGLPNRACFNSRFDEILAQGDLDWGLILVDLDNLKLVNDTFGHGAGDALICAVASRITPIVDGDRLFRLGGDEFALIAPLDGDGSLQSAARAIGQAMEAPCDCAGNVVHPSATMGGAVIQPGQSSEAIRQSADLALYHAKERARGGFVTYQDGMGTAISERYRAIREVTLALSEQRIEAFYQPIINMRTGAVIGLEALCRMRNPDGSVTPAAAFHEATKDARVAAKLTRVMLDKVAGDMARWSAMGLGGFHVGVNVSSADFHNGNLREGLDETFARQGVPRDRLMIEVTESVYLDQRDRAIADEIGRLRSQGIKVALDDFGTGFASLTHLMTIPIDAIKIDKSFTRGVTEPGPSRIIMEGIVQIAQRLGLTVIAEGVETAEQATECCRIGCNVGQGYLYARAAPFGVVTDMIRDKAVDLSIFQRSA